MIRGGNRGSAVQLCLENPVKSGLPPAAQFPPPRTETYAAAQFALHAPRRPPTYPIFFLSSDFLRHRHSLFFLLLYVAAPLRLVSPPYRNSTSSCVSTFSRRKTLRVYDQSLKKY
ncbi:hypothetical protein SDJN03_00614, partial [Cucurbita argyrosperma subsp. sororia]